MDEQPRIEPQAEPLPPGLAGAIARLVPAGVKPPQLFLTVGRNAGLFQHLVDTGLIGPTGLLDRRVLRPELRECRSTSAASTWTSRT